ncbi:MAG: methyltransferase domain-containing protein [Candidatus Aquirickettsiella sp.]
MTSNCVIGSPLKQPYLEIEDHRLASFISDYAGRHLLQLSPHSFSCLSASPIIHKIRVSLNSKRQLNTDKIDYSSLESLYTHLPFANDSINLVLMPHTLEADKTTAQTILTEAWRILAPNGHLVILGVNPISLWGLYRLLSFSKEPAWDGRFHTIQTLCQWIHFLGGEIQHTESFLFRPPFSSTTGLWLFKKLAWLERISPWLIPYMGGIYLIIAEKRVKRLNGLGLVWQFPPVLNSKVLAQNARGPHHA